MEMSFRNERKRSNSEKKVTKAGSSLHLITSGCYLTCLFLEPDRLSAVVSGIACQRGWVETPELSAAEGRRGDSGR